MKTSKHKAHGQNNEEAWSIETLRHEIQRGIDSPMSAQPPETFFKKLIQNLRQKRKTAA